MPSHPPARRALRLLGALLTMLIAAVAAVSLASPAQAATLTPVSSFGSNPGNLAMHVYRPDGIAAGRPVVVLLYGCTQNASAYFSNSGWRKYADLWSFTLIVPETNSGNNSLSCYNWFQPADASRGQGEAASIRSMVGHAVSTYGVDASRVYVTGMSAGGAMSAVMLAAYPEVFAAGSVAAGLAYKCATSQSAASTCQYGPVSKTPQQWGDLVRGAYPGYTGSYPRVAIWHGLSDTTVVPANATQLRDQFTNVRGVSQTPTSTASLPGNTALSVYGDNDVRLYQITGMAHGLPIDPGAGADQCGTAAAYFLDTICSAYHDARFFGLDGGAPPASPSPSTPASPAPSPSVSPSAPPSPSPTGAPVCVTASNYAHVVAGRAYQSGGYAWANGSGQKMGLYNTFYTSVLKQTGPNYWVIGC